MVRSSPQWEMGLQCHSGTWYSVPEGYLMIGPKDVLISSIVYCPSGKGTWTLMTSLLESGEEDAPGDGL